MDHGRIADPESRSGNDCKADEEPTPARIEAFSDGVFAIIITLLVLDLRVPTEAIQRGQPLWLALLQQWPVYVAYVLSVSYRSA